MVICIMSTLKLFLKEILHGQSLVKTDGYFNRKGILIEYAKSSFSSSE
jgi:hypothetical protein